ISQVLHRQVYIEKIDVSIFSIVSGIEIKKVAISNFKTPQQLAALQGKPVPANDLFTGMESLLFKIRFLPLLRKQFDLKELVLYSPVINLAKNKQGVLNCDDLIKSKKQSAEEEVKQPAKPITADDLPVAVTVGEIGIKNGTINYYDGQNDQRFQVYKLTTLAYDINIAPKELEKKDDIKLKLALGLKTVGAMKTGSVQSFDIALDATGKVIPFDVKTRHLDPEVILHIAVPDGEITGLQIFNSVASIPLLGDYLGQYISFLKGKQQWKDSKETGVDVRYKDNKADLTNGRLDLKEAKLLFDGAVNTDSKALDMNMDMVMKKDINEGVKSALAKKIEAAIKSPEAKKYADSNKLADAAIEPMLNKDGQIDLKLKVGGTTKKTNTALVKPQLDSLGTVVKKAAGGVATQAGKQLLQDMLFKKK
ncbi:MAG: AsmA family protein, partial [Smithellaceae bacterium]